jgi:ketosteroid isomerase-like protein
MTRHVIGALALVVVGCTPTPPPPPSQSEVQEFVRQYVAAANGGDASKLMELISRGPEVSSIGYGNVERGWETIRKSTDANIAQATRIRFTVGTVDVVPLGNEFALATATMFLTPLKPGQAADLPGAATIVVKRTPEGLRLIHEHYSVRVP